MELTEQEKANWKAFTASHDKIDYGEVPEIKKPSFDNVRLIRGEAILKQCTNFKYIDNKYINSPNRAYPGFSLVGKAKTTGRWRLLRIWGYW